MGIPVVLAYLGFLNIDEMPDPFPSAAAWRNEVKEHSDGIVPASVWESKVTVGNTPIYPIIRSFDLQWIPFGNPAREDA